MRSQKKRTLINLRFIFQFQFRGNCQNRNQLLFLFTSKFPSVVINWKSS
jgi:hypothetical protein